ncbi:thioredoxin-like protein [Mycena rosella]|uniref:Thioredoxin-like protein n=1 Tax=Mycena rosella TaxID=1033263 RepID=A0AAD7DI31_MYCRO|nr:thioredoxin-like protein [Mycena rosella]
MLPVSIITCFALASAARAAHPLFIGSPLTRDNFKSTIAKGIWFVEHLTPHCNHCRTFTSTWIHLTEQSEGMQLAQVDCNANGDLCRANGITGYPQMNLCYDGVFVEQYRGTREFFVLSDYLAEKAASLTAPPLPSSLGTAPLNPAGEVIPLSPDNFHQTLEQGPAFYQLAKSMQGRVTIAEMNCDAHRKFCVAQDVVGYPMLVFYPPGGPKSEYQGGCKLMQLQSFVEEASANALPANHLPTAPELAQDTVQLVMQAPPTA